MTEPAPLPTTPLLTKERLAVWTQERPLTDPEFADLVIESVGILLRQYGDPYWEIGTLPARARDIGYFVARNYYLNPDLVRQDSTGPLQSTVDNKVLQGVDLTHEQKQELAALATDAPGEVDGLWAMSYTRGEVEMHQRNSVGNVVIWDTRGGWPIEYLHGSEAVVFEPEV